MNMLLNNIPEIMLGLAMIYIGYLLYRINSLHGLSDYYLESWSKWEREYWNLRTSDAVDSDNYQIHISWLTYGDDNIKPIKAEK